MPQLPRHWLNILGASLGLLGMVFVIDRLSSYAGQVDVGRFGSTAWWTLAIMVVVYGIANLLLALAWWQLLLHLGACVTTRWAVKAYGISQLGRYVPGNVFHFVGRQALGLASGVAGRQLVKSALWELGLVATAGTILGVLATALPRAGLSVEVAAAAAGATFAVLELGLCYIVSARVGIALALQVAFLSISGAVFVGTVALIVPTVVSQVGVAPLMGAFTVAWLVGLVTPGAPAGMGIREVVLFFLLNGMMGEGDLLMSVIAARLVAMAGDLLFFTAVLSRTSEK
jgi:uncharacterized membrane protein YbhN (UPF0104 family)